MGILDKAREVTAAATTRAAELRDQATDAASSATERAAASLREQASDLATDLRERAATLSAALPMPQLGASKRQWSISMLLSLSLHWLVTR